MLESLCSYTHATFSIQEFFLPVVAWTPTLKSHRPKGNIKNLVICLLSTAPFALMLGRFWHLPGVFFELRVSQTVHITPVAHFSYTGLNEGRNNLRCGSVWLLELWNRDNFGIKGSEMVLCIKSCLVLWLLQFSLIVFCQIMISCCTSAHTSFSLSV